MYHLLSLLLAPLAAQEPQEPTVAAVTISETVVPARPGDEGPLRYPRNVPANHAHYQPVPEPRYSGVHRGPEMLAVYDVETGVESFFSAISPAAPAGAVTGREPANAVREDMQRSFGSMTSISDASIWPYRAQCRVFFTQAGVPDCVSGCVCSGTLIDAKNIITAGHCVHEGAGGAWSTGVSVSPAWDGDDDAYGSANAENLGSFTGWTVNGSFDGDMGFIRLDRPVGFLTGWFGYGYNTSTSWWDSTTFFMVGYPGASTGWAGAPDQLYLTAGDWDTINTSTVEADEPWANTTSGMSGTGDYVIVSSSRYVYANHSYRADDDTIGACRMTSTKFNFLKDTFIPGGRPAAVDYVPLNMSAATSVVNDGGTVSSVSFKCYNISSVNPASATVDLELYLSTNDNISTLDTLLRSSSFTYDFPANGGVKVNMSPVTIPLGTAAGDYWMGVIIDETDFDTNNNDTDGWDAKALTVL